MKNELTYDLLRSGDVLISNYEGAPYKGNVLIVVSDPFYAGNGNALIVVMSNFNGFIFVAGAEKFRWYCNWRIESSWT